ncbi:hypothetical protein PISMIDRAFT_676879 [Pisolithus microcarpus 441]|uniref:Uncharacterized protein n=1 Tax=Pisolithus microcarpus 441 TaxID=765257 RepID=A0A0C9YLQ8_9AGAM|nr:hypothetical protein BKA83DRAFT_676879 [Pisolithus microcarpus]KIK25915.1 hypothetical protein PISMIDRAFT_676879 [Pisolithus microcarpus 441]
MFAIAYRQEYMNLRTYGVTLSAGFPGTVFGYSSLSTILLSAHLVPQRIGRSVTLMFLQSSGRRAIHSAITYVRGCPMSYSQDSILCSRDGP